MKIILMLIWVGGGTGGPAVVQGFHSLEACDAAIPILQAAKGKDGLKRNIADAVCVSLPAE